MPLRSLADDLRSRTAGQIGLLITRRPDLASPWPSDLGQLARKAADDASVLEAMQGMDTTALRVLEVFAALHEATVEQVAEVLPESLEQVAEAVEGLWAVGLLWGGPTFRIVRAAQQAFGPHPCGLAAAGHAAPDEQDVIDAAEQYDPEDLAELVWRVPVRTAAHQLLTPRGDVHVLSREASLILRRGLFLQPAPDPPVHPAAERPPGDSLMIAVAGVRYVISDLRRRPMACNPARGVSRRVVADRAQSMGVPVADALVWWELAAGAGLIGVTDGHAGVTADGEAWLAGSPERMWLTLIDAWLESDRLLPMCTPEDLGVMTTGGTPRTSHHRRNVLRCWPDHARIDAGELAETVAWQRPRMHEAVDQVPAFFAEAVALGLVEGGVATAALELLPDDPRAAAATLPPPADGPSLIVQPDLTVIAPVTIDTATWQLLYDIASVESWGPVTMHRIEPARLRSAIVGRGPQEVLDTLAAASRTPLPQSLEYLVGDAARTSSARVYPATVVEVTGVDAEAVAGLGFTRLSEHVFASDLPDDVVRTQLAAAGVAAEPAPVRQLSDPLDYPRPSPLPDADALSRLVGHLVTEASPAVGEPPVLSVADPELIAQVCRETIESAGRLWVRYTQGREQLTELLEPVELRSGRLTGWSLSSGRTVTVPLSRIAAYGGHA